MTFPVENKQGINVIESWERQGNMQFVFIYQKIINHLSVHH